MGNTVSSYPPPPPFPDKTTTHHLRETAFDDLPVWDKSELPFTPVRIDLAKLMNASPDEIKSFGDELVEGLKKDAFVILKASPDFYQSILKMREESKLFLSRSEEEKKRIAPPHKINDERAFYSGYSLIVFDNRDSRRDKEWRDVFQLRLSETGHIPWPSDSFKDTAISYYMSQWSLCVQVLRCLAHSFGVDESTFLDLTGAPRTEEGSSSESKPSEPSPYASENTNLCFFHYYDKMQSYTTPQKCMVHEDFGVLTVLPKTDMPGIELLHPEHRQWFILENYIQDDEVLLFTGLSMAKVTQSVIPAVTHRVTRQPKVERFSMPFELKPNNDTLLKPLFPVEGKNECQTFGVMDKELRWKKIQRQVRRTDWIEPGSEQERKKIEAERQHEEAMMASTQSIINDNHQASLKAC